MIVTVCTYCTGLTPTSFPTQNQELLIKTIEDQEKNREETRVFQDQIMSMKQDNQHLAMNLAIKSQQGPSDGKKKPFYKTIFKSKKTKVIIFLVVIAFSAIFVLKEKDIFHKS